MTETIIGSIIGALGILGALFFAFLRGRSSGTSSAEAEHNTKRLEEINAQQVVVEEIKAKIQESDSAVNSQERADLIDGLIADSLRRTGGENR